MHGALNQGASKSNSSWMADHARPGPRVAWAGRFRYPYMLLTLLDNDIHPLLPSIMITMLLHHHHVAPSSPLSSLPTDTTFNQSARNWLRSPTPPSSAPSKAILTQSTFLSSPAKERLSSGFQYLLTRITEALAISEYDSSSRLSWWHGNTMHPIASRLIEGSVCRKRRQRR